MNLVRGAVPNRTAPHQFFSFPFSFPFGKADLLLAHHMKRSEIFGQNRISHLPAASTR